MQFASYPGLDEAREGLALVEDLHRRTLVLSSALLLSLGLGSIHAFSVLLDPLEQHFVASRAEIAPAYAIGLASLTLAVLFGHRLYALLPPAILALLTCLLAAFGLAAASMAPNPLALWIGYGVIFGFANGVGYGFALHITNQAFERHRGLAMGSVTAIYAVGATGFATLLDRWIEAFGIAGALLSLSAVLAIMGLLAGTGLWWSRSRGATSGQSLKTAVATPALDRGRLWLCWMIYGAGVAAGLMAMGHAAGIVTASGGGVEDGVKGVIAITSANAIGGFSAGYLADRHPGHVLLSALGAVSATALLVLAVAQETPLVIAMLALVGFCYGAIIALFPIVTAMIFGRDAYALAYGRIFTSWGLAGLTAPWFAGILFSQTSGYGLALVVAAIFAVLSGGLSLLLAKTSAIAISGRHRSR